MKTWWLPCKRRETSRSSRYRTTRFQEEGCFAAMPFASSFLKNLKEIGSRSKQCLRAALKQKGCALHPLPHIPALIPCRSHFFLRSLRTTIRPIHFHAFHSAHICSTLFHAYRRQAHRLKNLPGVE